MIVCSVCSASLVDGARFCSACGASQGMVEAGERREFVIPIPADSPFNTPLGGNSENLLTKQQLRLLGVSRPQPGDFMPFRGFTHLWSHFSDYVRSRIEDLKAEGWELDEPFDLKQDYTGVVTPEGIRQRFLVEEVSVARGAFGARRPAVLLKGFKFKMKRVETEV